MFLNESIPMFVGMSGGLVSTVAAQVVQKSFSNFSGRRIIGQTLYDESQLHRVAVCETIAKDYGIEHSIAEVSPVEIQMKSFDTPYSVIEDKVFRLVEDCLRQTQANPCSLFIGFSDEDKFDGASAQEVLNELDVKTDHRVGVSGPCAACKLSDILIYAYRMNLLLPLRRSYYCHSPSFDPERKSFRNCGECPKCKRLKECIAIAEECIQKRTPNPEMTKPFISKD